MRRVFSGQQMCYSHSHGQPVSGDPPSETNLREQDICVTTERTSSPIAQLAVLLQPLLSLPPVRRTRRNHGLEHATIHVLAGRIRGLKMAGRSNADGFVLLGEASTEAVASAVREALNRMRAGERALAVHPNCGTNLVTAGFLATIVSMLGFAGGTRRDMWNRMPLVMSLIMLAFVAAQPLGMALQRHLTTDGDPADLEVVSITRSTVSLPFGAPLTVHRIVTRSS